MNNKILKLTFILFLVCAITAGILGGVNELTRERIANIEQQKTAKAYAAVIDADSFEPVSFDKAAFPTVNGIYKAGDAGYVVESTFSGAQGSITMATGVSSDYKCTGISIISHSETSGLGANAASTGEVGVNFRSQFVGEDDTVALSKAGGNIDALTGATITSRSVTNACALSIKAVESLG